MLDCCVLLGLDWAEPMMLFMLQITCSCIFMHTYLHFFIFLYWFVWFFFACLSFPLSFLCFSALWYLNANLLRPRTLFFPQHLLLLPPFDPTPSHIRFHDDKSRKDFWRTSHDEAFIRNAKSFYQTFSILTFPQSSTVGVRSHCVASWSLVPPWSYRSFTPICMDSIIQYLILSLAFKILAS